MRGEFIGGSSTGLEGIAGGIQRVSHRPLNFFPKPYTKGLTINIFNGGLAPTIHEGFNTLDEVVEFLKTREYSSYVVYDVSTKVAYGEKGRDGVKLPLEKIKIPFGALETISGGKWHVCDSSAGITETGYVESKVSGQKFNRLKAPLDIVQTVQFPKALQLLALATEYGHFKYKESDTNYLNFKNVHGGSQAYNDASARHATDRKGVDIESGLHHIIHEVWNKLASLELWVEENNVNVGEYSKDYLEKLKQ